MKIIILTSLSWYENKMLKVQQHAWHCLSIQKGDVMIVTPFFLVDYFIINNAAAKSLQSCLTLCDPRDGSPPGSLVPEILQARTLEWVAISFSNVWKWQVKVKSFSHVRPSATPWTADFQAPPSVGFSRQECWSGAPLPSPINDANPSYYLKAW